MKAPPRYTTTAFTAPVTCPHCGTGLDLTASGTTNGYRSQVVVRCGRCHRRWQLVAELIGLDHTTTDHAA